MSQYHHARKMAGTDCRECENGTIRRVGNDGAECRDCGKIYL